MYPFLINVIKKFKKNRYAREVERKPVGLYTLLHTVKTSETSVKTFSCMQTKAGDDSMQQS